MQTGGAWRSESRASFAPGGAMRSWPILAGGRLGAGGEERGPRLNFLDMGTTHTWRSFRPFLQLWRDIIPQCCTTLAVNVRCRGGWGLVLLAGRFPRAHGRVTEALTVTSRGRYRPPLLRERSSAPARLTGRRSQGPAQRPDRGHRQSRTGKRCPDAWSFYGDIVILRPKGRGTARNRESRSFRTVVNRGRKTIRHGSFKPPRRFRGSFD